MGWCSWCGGSDSEREVRKAGQKTKRDPITATIRANKSPLAFLSVTIGLQILAGLASRGLVATHRLQAEGTVSRSLLCRAARCGCGTGVMILCLMWVYLSRAGPVHVLGCTVAQKVKTPARTQPSCGRKNAAAFHTASIPYMDLNKLKW